MDTVSPETRSRIMAGIRGTNTKPELFVRKGLFARGYRFRVNCKDLPGHPDLKLTKHGAIILVHGCFWHGHDCRLFRLPSSNVAYWTAKIGRNRERDLEDLLALREAGWRVCVVWECAERAAAAGRDKRKLLDGIADWLDGDRPFVEFFDTAAVGGSAVHGKPPKRPAIGKRCNAGSFAAERKPRYSSSMH